MGGTLTGAGRSGKVRTFLDGFGDARWKTSRSAASQICPGLLVGGTAKLRRLGWVRSATELDVFETRTHGAGDGRNSIVEQNMMNKKKSFCAVPKSNGGGGSVAERHWAASEVKQYFVEQKC